ncbi:Similar to Mtus1: Microtubule-associated tumor suppressor 1 homolog (Mus musculus) [Cotesia congregata]|uniref:Similar to Mtus1: Microtubule-associated tumor suppressor 1 homolog (Mus musculus) n=1 Tax=Cotesia congregata TaxID=51543 RepID=A0A8J2HUE7_COTCN|nr:Similar to Mtus1: Microtubule-associated tumor suppressor 1 homolog (Mus musculus) [Cotesia congregata]
MQINGESKIPVSRVPRPSFLLKPKIITPSKHSTAILNVTRDRKSIISGCFSPHDSDETIVLRTPRTWSIDKHIYSSTPPDTAKLPDTSFKSSGVWTADSNVQHDLSSQRKDEKYFNNFYDSSSMIDDIGSSCLIDSSVSSNFDVSGSSCLNTPQQYLVLNKQNSFEHDESLGILTPDQMTDFTIALGCSRTPSYENLTGSRLAGTSSSSSRASRPTNVPFVVDVDAPGNFCERSPSLEELPLDDSKPLNIKLLIDDQTGGPNQVTTTAAATAGISGVAVSNASLPMSFVTSVTSITSLEAGYQGDGENSRPASRGPDPPLVLPDNLPASCRLQDPMTDSDFFTESDADAHEDIGRGDRRAQVIDGTLFCAPAGRRCPSFAGEEMDSSGIYSDLDKRHDERYNLEEPLSEDHTPDTANTGDTPDTQVSPKSRLSPTLKPEVPQTISNYLQVPKSPEDMAIEATPEKNEITVIHIVNDSAERSSTPKLLNKSDQTGLKKYKMPKKNVASKIKAMIECGVKEDVKEQRRVSRTPRKSGRWDAVMSKIEAGKTEQRTRPPRKEVKSRILQNLVATSSSSSSSSSTSSSSAVTVASAKRLPGDANNNSNAIKDKRRSRIRQSNASPTQETARSSVRSSMSDISSATSKGTASKRSPGNINQQRRIVNGRGSLKQNTLNNDSKKNCLSDLSPLNLDKSPTPIRKSSSIRRATTLTNGVSTNEKQQNGSGLMKDRIIKELAPRATSIETRHQEAQTTDFDGDLKRADDFIQGLCITVQYVTRQFEDHTTMTQTKLYNLKNAYGNLEETLDKERQDHEKAIDELLEGIYEERIKDLESTLQEERDEFQVQLKTSLDKLAREHEVIIERLKSEQELEIKAKENYWSSKQVALESLDKKSELEALKKDYESLKLSFKPAMSFKNGMIKKLKSEIENLKRQVKDKSKLEKRVRELEDQIERESKLSKDLIYADSSPCEIESTSLSSDQVAVLRAEIWSLRSVLELRSQENSAMRSENDKLRRDVEGKEALEQRVETLEARCEDLKAQLQSKESYERQIAHENEILLGSFHEISKQNKRVTQKNEELQWRLRQKSEVVNVLANQLATPTQRLSRSLGPEHIDHSMSGEKNPPATSSSMIKFMVHKGDSVSWTLEIDESCDPLPNVDPRPAVSRQNSLRRVPRKSLDIRERSKSVSTSDAGTNNSEWAPNYNSTPLCARRRPRSDPSSNAIVANPPLVSTNESHTGPRPQEAGGEAMISEEASATSSEDESSASSDIPRLPMGFDWNDSVE